MTTTGNAAVERLEAHLASLRASYLDVVRDSLIGRLNEDPPLPASKVDRYYDSQPALFAQRVISCASASLLLIRPAQM